MKCSYLTIVYYCLTIIIYSCGDTQDNKERNIAKLYVETIDMSSNEIDYTGENFENYFFHVGPLAKGNSNYQIDETMVDSLRYYYNAYILSFDSAISKINRLPNSKNLDILKTIYLDFLTQDKNDWASVIPVFISVFTKGWKLSSAEEKQTILGSKRIFEQNLQDISARLDLLEKESNRIAQKYRIVRNRQHAR